MSGRSETPQRQQLTSCKNTRNEKSVRMDGRSEQHRDINLLAVRTQGMERE